jgi:hypothetical protein
MNLSWLTMFIDSGKVGGYVRAGVAAVLPVLIAKVPGLSIDPATQAAIGVVASWAVVGVWSHVTKT